MEPLRDTPAPRDTLAPLPDAAPRFHLIDRKPPSVVAIVLAIVVAGGGGRLIIRGLRNSAHARQMRDGGGATRGGSTAGGAPAKGEKDDPNQIDTIVLGDAADAPVPARKGEKSEPSEVHPTILIRLPRYGDDVGLIPDTPTGHMLYQWLAAFNQGSLPALEHLLPNEASFSTAASQMALRVQTGGFFLVSAREIQPGVMVFRLRDQTPEANEVLGTLHMRDSKPPTIASLSIRSVQPTIKSHSADAQDKNAPVNQEKREHQ